MKKIVNFLFLFLMLLCFSSSSLHAGDDEKAGTARILTSSGSSLYSASAVALGKDDSISYFLTSAFFISTGSEFYIIPEAVIDEKGNYLEKDAAKVEVLYTDSALNLSVLKAETPVSNRYQPAEFKSVDTLGKGDEIRSLGYKNLKSTKLGESAVKDVLLISGKVMENTCSKENIGNSCIQLSDDFTGTTDKEAAFLGGAMIDSQEAVVGMRNMIVNGSQAELQHMTTADAIMKLLDERNIPYLQAASSASFSLPALAAGAGGIMVILTGFGFLKKKKQEKQTAANTHAPFAELNAEKQPMQPNEQHPAASAAFVIMGIQGVYQGQSFPLEDKIVLGRDAGCCHILFENTAGVSRMHCFVQLKQGSCVLCDLHATYGTFLNQRKLKDGEEVILQIGDIFSLGNQENSFQLQKRGV